MPPSQPSKRAVEALAKFEFDRLERGDLRVVGGKINLLVSSYP